ncbi:hypothetical protein BV25DRAFT_1246777 [Artomyces pyxidatus]|uniref:Uncharacterized protein n=2 Tax=Artomyces pyxidatus TaxID=48021 RepID=A0ACB8TEF2_9AGAM|nr:hypothetical protein BV25DRAFT_435815 [Artomyces pyxidatus]KAI0066813.1 hypothetical protein BV25DRAFT_1246777 [Artomyces pyxidatus]
MDDFCSPNSDLSNVCQLSWAEVWHRTSLFSIESPLPWVMEVIESTNREAQLCAVGTDTLERPFINIHWHHLICPVLLRTEEHNFVSGGE